MVDVALLLGGPSAERGISLNSARSVADHLAGGVIDLKEIIFFDRQTRPFAISRGLLYCNTPSDFDFKLAHEGRPLTEDELLSRLRGTDLVFPVMHGEFGEDGGVQALLERAGVPYVGTGAQACATAFDKYKAKQALDAAGIGAVPSVLVDAAMSDAEAERVVAEAFPDAAKLVLKPARGGSSIDVFVARDRGAAADILRGLRKRHDRIVVQPRMGGVEVTTIVLEGPDGPVALLPVEIELHNRAGDHEIFDYRRKYLASNDSHYHCPPPRDDATIAGIQATSEAVFTALGLRDFARIDGWLQPDGSVLVSDVNPISGMEQNSFLFIQAAQLGMTHADVLLEVLRAAARRHDVPFPEISAQTDSSAAKQPVAVLFGGSTAERQVSVLSGTNVWLKLARSGKYAPVPYLLDPDGSVWQVSYSSALRHSVEEIVSACRDGVRLEERRGRLAARIVERLRLAPGAISTRVTPPVQLTMEDFLGRHDLVFIALHGGAGENGTLQEVLDRHGIRYNGSGPAASRLCMDKYETGKVVAGLAAEGIHTARRIRVAVPETLDDATIDTLWQEIVTQCTDSRVVVKPLDDGCSAGILPLGNAADLRRYLEFIHAGAARLSGAGFSLLSPEQLVEMPTSRPSFLLFEDYIDTDDVRVEDGSGAAELIWGRDRDTGWIEVTVGVIGPKGAMVAMNPSITVASAGILSLEEKFMGGTGINITPPPGPPLGRVEPGAVEAVRARIARTANVLGMEGYGRIDAFMHRKTGEIIVIEANALPGLTPATVFYHQGLAEEPPVPPQQILERILDLATHS
ncbi:D-alanine--D-alanine ligase family protein [Dactylosporangium sp. CA-092794]|uniref:D-alanine--D-alanine ligase family protein n=1 Tax=Dactylosporangium sp. CA-092794 TaxID=3239929 RepID=UPI003D8FF124